MARSKGTRRRAMPAPTATATEEADLLDLGRELEDSDLMDEGDVGDVTVVAAPSVSGGANVPVDASAVGGASATEDVGAGAVLKKVAEIYNQDPAAFVAAYQANGVAADPVPAPVASVANSSNLDGAGPVDKIGDISTISSGSSDGGPVTVSDTSGSSADASSSGVGMDTSQDDSISKDKESSDFYECVSFLEDHVRQHFPVTARPTTLVDVPMIVQRLQKSQDVLNLDQKGNLAIEAAEKLTRGVKTYVNSMRSVMDHMSVSIL